MEVNFTDTNPHDFRLEYSHSGDLSGGGVTLNWEAPAQAQIDEAVAAAKASDVVVAFVGLSPQLEGEEMPIKIEGFSGGDRTSIDLPAAQQHLLEALGTTGKPVIVVSLSGSALALTWAKEHAAAIIQAWYPGRRRRNRDCAHTGGRQQSGGPLAGYVLCRHERPARVHRLLAQEPYLSLLHGQAAVGLRIRAELFGISVRPGEALKRTVAAGKPVTATVTVTNNSKVAGDEVVEAYLKTPQSDGPINSLVGFQRVHLNPGQSRDVTLELSPRSLSAVDAKGQRSILPGTYHLSVGSTQPSETTTKSEADFTVSGTVALPK